MESVATLVLSNHRPETIEPAGKLMAAYDAVVLEEPPFPQFHLMLSGRLDINDYLEDLNLDFEYPASKSRLGDTRWPLSMTEPNSPRIILIKKLGAGNYEGRPMVLPRTRAKSRF